MHGLAVVAQSLLCESFRVTKPPTCREEFGHRGATGSESNGDELTCFRFLFFKMGLLEMRRMRFGPGVFPGPFCLVRNDWQSQCSSAVEQWFRNSILCLRRLFADSAGCVNRPRGTGVRHHRGNQGQQRRGLQVSLQPRTCEIGIRLVLRLSHFALRLMYRWTKK